MESLHGMGDPRRELPAPEPAVPVGVALRDCGEGNEVKGANAGVGPGEEPFREARLGPSVPMSAPPKTFISDLRPGRVATIEATVARLEPIREVEQRSGGLKKVRNGTLKDRTGEISLVLWGDEVELVAEGDTVRIVEGWVKDYKGRPQISLGSTGRLEKSGP